MASPESFSSSAPSSFRSNSTHQQPLFLDGRDVLGEGPSVKANACTYISITISALGALMFGINQTSFGIVQQQESFYEVWCKPFYEDFDCKPENANAPAGWMNFRSWSTSLPMLGGVVGCLFLAPLVSSKFGRRPCISLGGFICFVGSLSASYVTYNNSHVFLAGRFVMGFGISLCCFAVPLYNSEVAPPQMRGVMGSVFQFMVVLGGVLAAFLVAISSEDWRFAVFLPGIPGLVVSAAIWFTPESPRFVMMRNEDSNEGLIQLRRLRSEVTESEAHSMRHEYDVASETGLIKYTDMFTLPDLRHRVFIVCYLQVAQQLTCVNAFLSYTSNVLEAAGLTQEDVYGEQGKMYTLWLNIAMLIGCILGALLIDSKYGGRYRQLMASTVTMGPALMIAGIAILAKWAHWIPIVMFFIWAVFFQSAWGIVPWVYPSETFSMNERDRAVSTAICSIFLANFAINFVTLPLLTWSAGMTFIIFGGLNLSNAVFVSACIRETRGVPLAIAPSLFDNRTMETINEDDEEDDGEDHGADNEGRVALRRRILDCLGNLYLEVFFELATLLLAMLVLAEGIGIMKSYPHMQAHSDSEDAFGLFCLFYCVCMVASMACCVRRRPWVRWRHCAVCWDGPFEDSDELGNTVMYATVAWLRIIASVIFIVGHWKLPLHEIIAGTETSAVLRGFYNTSPIVCGVYSVLLFIVASLQLCFVRPSAEDEVPAEQSQPARRRRRVKLQAAFPVRQCIICYTQPANVMARACRHAAVCEECFLRSERDGVIRCSICRTVVTDYDVGIQQGFGYKNTYVSSSASAQSPPTSWRSDATTIN